MLWIWAGFFTVVLVLLALDLGVFHRSAHAIGIKEASLWTALWVVLGLSFTVLVYFMYEQHWFGAALAEVEPHTGHGGEAALLYVTGYLIEKSLSMDNIFVIALIFHHFQVHKDYQHRILYWGILGALIMRGGMIFGGAYLLTEFTWLFYPFGGYLVFAGIRMVLPEKGRSPDDQLVVRLVRKIVPVTTGDHGANFTTRVDGKFAFTILFLVLLIIELSDVVFAVDSVPAVLAITTDTFLVMTSNVFAILGLRSLYFVLSSAMERFRYLKYALAGILVVVGAKMIAHQIIHVPALVSLGVILGLLAGGIIASLARSRRAAT